MPFRDMIHPDRVSATVLPDIERKLIVATRSLQQLFAAFLHLFWYDVCGLLVFVMVYGLRLGHSRIFAAYSCCACFVAGEQGGGRLRRDATRMRRRWVRGSAEVGGGRAEVGV